MHSLKYPETLWKLSSWHGPEKCNIWLINVQIVSYLENVLGSQHSTEEKAEKVQKSSEIVLHCENNLTKQN